MATPASASPLQKIQRRLHILHLSTGEEAELLRQDKPAWVTAEVTPQHLLLNTDAYKTIGTLAQMNPPLRSPRDNEILWQALLDGVIDFIATDHAPHTLEAKGQRLSPHAFGNARCGNVPAPDADPGDEGTLHRGPGC